MTDFIAWARWIFEIFSRFEGNIAASKKTAIVAAPALINPLPPSSNPNALPCASLPPHSRVARIIAAQKSKIVVIPQYPKRIVKPN